MAEVSTVAMLCQKTQALILLQALRSKGQCRLSEIHGQLLGNSSENGKS